MHSCRSALQSGCGNHVEVHRACYVKLSGATVVAEEGQWCQAAFRMTET